MKYTKITLKNGLRIITVPMKGTQTATVMVAVGVGSRYEIDSEAGLSHFIEHMLFKGTHKRPDWLAITEELDGIGGEANAFTGKERTYYYAKTDFKHVDTAFDVISDMYLNSKIDEEEIKKESGTILQEINMYEDLPTRDVENIFEQLLFKGSSLERDILGTKKTITSFSRKDFIDYMKRFYVASNTVVCISGKFNEKKMIDRISKVFGSMKKVKTPGISRFGEGQKKADLMIKLKKTDQTHFILGVRGYDNDHKDRFILSVMATILGGNMSSRIFGEVREKRGLAYYVRTGISAYRDCGYLETAAGVEHKNMNLAIETILGEYKKIASEKVTEKELIKAKEYIKGRNIMNLESSDEVAMFLVDQEIKKGKILSPEEVFKKIDAVTANDILRVAKDIFREDKLNLAIIGPHKDEQKVKALLKL